jgi:hypothetical protein
MKIRMTAVSACLVFLITVSSAYGQQGRRPPVSRDPCPGGAGTGIIDGINVPSLENLVQISELIIKGAVVKVLPSNLLDRNRPNLIETTSLISVEEVLRGTPAAGAKTISISQLGGQVVPCSLVIQDDPIFAVGEEYILFLVPDNRTNPPNNSGSPRYSTAGVYSGKAKIVNGRIQFRANASEGLRKYDNTDVAAFTNAVKARASSLVPRKTP